MQSGYRNEVEAGDIVLVWFYHEWQERIVKRVTKTQIVIGNEAYEAKFRKSDGYRVGRDYSSDRLKAVNEKELEEFRVRKQEQDELKNLRLEVQNKMRDLPRYKYMTKEELEVLLSAANEINQLRVKTVNS